MQMATIRLFTASQMTSPARDIRETTRACEYHIGQVQNMSNACILALFLLNDLANGG